MEVSSTVWMRAVLWHKKKCKLHKANSQHRDVSVVVFDSAWRDSANSGRHVAHEVSPHELDHLKDARDPDWLCIHLTARKSRLTST